MLKKTVVYENFNGVTVQEDLFFHLSKADLVELEMSEKGGLSSMIEEIVQSEDGKAIIAEFKRLLLKAYGKKSEDGKRFIKTQELRDEFESSEAYSTLFMELVTNAEAAAEFVRGVIPAGLAQDMAKLSERQKDKDPASPNLRTMEDNPQLEEAKAMQKQRVLTRQEAIAMNGGELQHLLSTGQAIIGS